MTLLDTHLEQISLSSAAISDLPFQRPRIFTNALLHNHDITALIRDTESHERSLFTVEPSTRSDTRDPSLTSHTSMTGGNATVNLKIHDRLSTSRLPRGNSAVAAVLGVDMAEQMRRAGGGRLGTNNYSETREKGDIDVEVLLQGAQKLCAVYPIAGALERIASLHSRYEQLASSISYYEARVTKQAAQLERMNRPKDFDADNEDHENLENEHELAPPEQLEEITEDDLRLEEEEIKELEKKKRSLEDRVSGMERDLGGLLR